MRVATLNHKSLLKVYSLALKHKIDMIDTKKYLDPVRLCHFYRLGFFYSGVWKYETLYEELYED